MTAKKKRKKLIINSQSSEIAHQFPRYPVPSSPAGFPASPSIVFDDCSGIHVDRGGGPNLGHGVFSGGGGNARELSQFVAQLFHNRDAKALDNLELTDPDAEFEFDGMPVRPLRLTSVLGRPGAGHAVSWCTVQWGTTLFVLVQSAVFPEGSRQSFVQLLDFAEEELGCERVMVAFPGEHKQRESIMKTFMFLGFVPVCPDNRLLPATVRMQPGEMVNEMSNSGNGDFGENKSKLSFLGYIIE